MLTVEEVKSGKWKFKVLDFKKTLDKYGEENLKELQAELKPLLENKIFDDFMEKEYLLNAEDVEEFDDFLDQLYDYADDKRIWMD